MLNILVFEIKEGMLRMQEMAFPCFKFQKCSGEYATDPPIHAWYVGHTRGLQPFLSPSNILSHRKVPFQKMPPPHGKILKKGPDVYTIALTTRSPSVVIIYLI
jgi:hypothetical protein